jgi:hypothetical protein
MSGLVLDHVPTRKLTSRKIRDYFDQSDAARPRPRCVMASRINMIRTAGLMCLSSFGPGAKGADKCPNPPGSMTGGALGKPFLLLAISSPLEIQFGGSRET